MGSESNRMTMIIGASRGIGRHLVGRAVGRGDRVIACARVAAALGSLRSASGTRAVETVVGDILSSTAEHGRLTDLASSHTGPISLLVTAATLGPVGPLAGVDVDDWIAALALNVGGAARILNTFTPLLTSADLLMFFSGGGVGGPSPQPNVSSYTTSKAALMHLVEVAARENPTGPTIVSVAPGAFPTGFTDPVIAAGPQVAGAALTADVEKSRSTPFDATRLERLLDYLEAPQGSRWLSGRTLSANRDSPDVLAQVVDQHLPDLYRLRRVDGVSVSARDW